MNFEASLHSLLSFAWTLTHPTNFNLLRQNIVFSSYSERIPVSFSWFFHYFSFFLCYFTLLLIFTKIIFRWLFYYIFFLMKIISIFSCSGMFRVPGFIDGQSYAGAWSAEAVNMVQYLLRANFFTPEFSCMPTPMCQFGRENEIQELTSFGRFDWVCPISFMEIRKHYNVIII